MYRQRLDAHPELIEAARRDLADRDAACWCPEPAPGEPDLCHGRALLDAVAAVSPVDDDADRVAPCGHTAPVNGCQCGKRVTAWWAETKRRLVEASPAYWAQAPGGPPVAGPPPAVVPAEPEQLILWGPG